MLAKNWNILHTNLDMANIFQDRPMVAFKRRPTLRDILTSSSVQFPYQETQDIITNPQVCKKSPGRCTCCPMISGEDYLICTNTNHKYDKLPIPTKGYLTCNISNIIYCITCKKCKKQNIGQSSRALGQRIYEHIYSVRFPLPKKTPVSTYFSSSGHSVKDLKFSVVEWFKQDPISSKALRLNRENFWIWSFISLHPLGLNQMM